MIYHAESYFWHDREGVHLPTDSLRNNTKYGETKIPGLFKSKPKIYTMNLGPILAITKKNFVAIILKRGLFKRH